MKRRMFPDGAEGAETFHRASSLGRFTSLQLGARIQDWSESGSPAAIKSDHPDCPRVPLPLPGTLARKRLGFLDSTLRRRRSSRELGGAPLTRREASILLWAAAGCLFNKGTAPRRTFPSAGGLESTALYLSTAAGEIPAGTWRYAADTSELVQSALATPSTLGENILSPGNPRGWPALFLFTSRLEPLLAKYGDRGYRFALLEIGHSAQNLLLAAAGLGFGAVPIGGFRDSELADAVGPAHDEAVLYAVGVGKAGARARPE